MLDCNTQRASCNLIAMGIVMVMLRRATAAPLFCCGTACAAWPAAGGVGPDRPSPTPGQHGAARKALGAVLAMSLLNPHVYLDTVVLLGAVGSSMALGERHAFAAGAMTASLLWFSMLGWLARRYAGVLGRPRCGAGSKAFTGATMLVLAGMLLRGEQA